MLYLVGTPIGNFEDMTLRAVETLKKVDIVAAEDTRNTLNLLNHFGISASLLSYHEHNKASRGAELLKYLQEGKDIALVTDAGMPAVSDPGEDLVRLCIENDIPLTVVPGPTAFVTAAVMSGMPFKGMMFEGFLPVKESECKNRLEELKSYKGTVVFYEAPHRLLKTLERIKSVFGNRNISVSREITKKFEETFRATIDEALNHFTQIRPRGEFVLTVEGAKEEKEVYIISETEHVDMLISEGLDKKSAIAQVAKIRNIPKKIVYNNYEKSQKEKCK